MLLLVPHEIIFFNKWASKDALGCEYSVILHQVLCF